MCNPISWWYVKAGGVRKVLISDKTDSHSQAADEFKIRDNGKHKVCAGEFWPDPANPSPDLKTWKMIWDYEGVSRRPEWMDDDEEAKLRKELEKRVKRYVYTTGEHTADSCRAFLFGDAILNVPAGLTIAVTARENSQITARENSRCKMESKYAFLLGRDWDGNGYKPLTVDTKIGSTYSIVKGNLEAVTT